MFCALFGFGLPRVAWIGGPWAAFRDTSNLQTMAWRFPRQHTRLRFLLFPRLFSVLMLLVYCMSVLMFFDVYCWVLGFWWRVRSLYSQISVPESWNPPKYVPRHDPKHPPWFSYPAIPFPVWNTTGCLSSSLKILIESDLRNYFSLRRCQTMPWPWRHWSLSPNGFQGKVFISPMGNWHLEHQP